MAKEKHKKPLAPVLRDKYNRDKLIQELAAAYVEAKRHKRATKDENDFEVFWMWNIEKLADEMLDGEYEPSRGIAFITHSPVDREIFAAPFRDRVVHHYICDDVEGHVDRHLIPNSFSCRKEKGTRYGVLKCQQALRRASQGGRVPATVIKLDIQGYFMSLTRGDLYERMRQVLKDLYPNGGIRYKMMRNMWAQVIFDNPTNGVRKRPPLSDWKCIPPSKTLFLQPPGKGIVIGNLSSQILSNLFLSRLDRFITITLGYKYYGRYVDDFFIVVPDTQKEQAIRDIARIEEFLLELGLVLHPKKRYIQPVENGIEFLGMWVHTDYITPGARFRKSFYRAAREVAMGRKDPCCILSYLGYCQGDGIKAKKLCHQVFISVGWDIVLSGRETVYELQERFKELVEHNWHLTLTESGELREELRV